MKGYLWDWYKRMFFTRVNSFNVGDIFNMTVSGSVFELNYSELGAYSMNGEQKSKLKFDRMPHHQDFLIKPKAKIDGIAYV